MSGANNMNDGLTDRQREKRPVCIELDDILLDESRLDQEVALLVAQYLESRSYGHIAKIIEEQVLNRSKGEYDEEIRDVERAIQDGDFGSLESLLARPGLLRPQSQKAFLYLCYRQQFLEHVENRESQKAFNLLSKRLKPLEHYQPIPYDFYSLSYLTSAGTVHDAPSFRDWAGVDPEREALVRRWREMVDAEKGRAELGEQEKRLIPPGRLVELLKQAGGWQVERCKRGRNGGPWRVPSLLKDYHPISIPSRLSHQLHTHRGGAKCVTPLALDGSTAVSGGSDTSLKIFSTTDGSILHTLEGHSSRIWDVDVDSTCGLIASASGDGSIRIWDASGQNLSAIPGSGGDVYGVRWRPGAVSGQGAQITTASYDRILRTIDVSTGSLIRTFSGHSQTTLCVAYDPAGSLLASGAKDRQVRLWDAIGGVCVNTMTACLGEVTSVEFDNHGRYLLVGSKDNSNRLWDLRMQRSLYRYTGHQNTIKNFIRCSFALDSSLVLGGSEDGNIYVWEREPSSSVASRNPAGAKAIPPTPDARSGDSGNGHPPASGTNVRVFAVLEPPAAHGAAFDVREQAGVVVCAWNDGHVGVWEGDEE